MNICSFVPGATEVVAALGLGENLVGISHECDFPPEIRNKPVLVKAAIDSERLSSCEIDQGVKQTVAAAEPLYWLDVKAFQQARPDLIITQDLCGICAITPGMLQEAIGSLPRSPDVLTLNPTSLNDVLHDVERIGRALGRSDAAARHGATLRATLQTVEDAVRDVETRPRVVCLEWLDPFYVAGHWVPDMVELAGGVDCLGSSDAPSRQVTWKEIADAAPDLLVLMPCGFSIDRTVRELDRSGPPPGWTQMAAVQQGNLFVVDAASYFSRPGPRLVEGVALLAALCHPSRFPAPPPDRVRCLNPLGAKHD